MARCNPAVKRRQKKVLPPSCPCASSISCTCMPVSSRLPKAAQGKGAVSEAVSRQIPAMALRIEITCLLGSFTKPVCWSLKPIWAPTLDYAREEGPRVLWPSSGYCGLQKFAGAHIQQLH